MTYELNWIPWWKNTSFEDGVSEIEGGRLMILPSIKSAGGHSIMIGEGPLIVDGINEEARAYLLSKKAFFEENLLYSKSKYSSEPTKAYVIGSNEKKYYLPDYAN